MSRSLRFINIPSSSLKNFYWAECESRQARTQLVYAPTQNEHDNALISQICMILLYFRFS